MLMARFMLGALARWVEFSPQWRVIEDRKGRAGRRDRDEVALAAVYPTHPRVSNAADGEVVVSASQEDFDRLGGEALIRERSGEVLLCSARP